MIRTSVPQIELRHLHRVFDDTHAVNDVSFTVEAGEVFGYIGPNGAGKTTSMRILATLDEPTAGDAFIDGFSVVEDPDRVRRRLGFMPDYFGTYQNVSVREYLDFFARAYGLRGTERSRAIRSVLDFTNLDTLAHPDRAGRDLPPRRDHRAGPAAGRGVHGRNQFARARSRQRSLARA